MRRLTGGAALFLSGFVLACQPEAASAPDLLAPQFATGVSNCDLSVDRSAVGNFYRNWNSCSRLIRVRSDPANTQDIASAITTAAQRWTDALTSPNAAGAARFAYAAPGASFDVTVRVNGSATTYCGATPTPNTVILDANTGSTVCKTNWSSLTNTLTHELGHVLGFNSNEHRGQVAGVSSHCAMYLPDDHRINSTVCQHEVEKVYAAYGIVPWSGTPTNFYGRHIVTGVNATPSSVSLVKGATATISVTQLRFARGAIASAALGSVGLAWTSDARTIADVTNGVITAVETGSTTVRVKVSSSLPSTYQLGGLMARHGTEIPVTVTPPPSPPAPSSQWTISYDGSYPYQWWWVNLRLSNTAGYDQISVVQYPGPLSSPGYPGTLASVHSPGQQYDMWSYPPSNYGPFGSLVGLRPVVRLHHIQANQYFCFRVNTTGTITVSAPEGSPIVNPRLKPTSTVAMVPAGCP